METKKKISTVKAHKKELNGMDFFEEKKIKWK